MGNFSQTQITAMVAALACVMALLAGFVHDRQMAERSKTSQPWIRPAQPLALLALATVLAILTAALALQGR
jgi:hypothetical protein